MDQLLDLLMFLIPIYVANSSPVVLGGGAPLDLGKTFSGWQRIFGNGKTMRGFVGGILAGTSRAASSACSTNRRSSRGRPQFIAAFLLSFGTMAGDALGELHKEEDARRFWQAVLLDTMLFLMVALVFVLPVRHRHSLYDPLNLLFFLILTLHPPSAHEYPGE